MDEILPLAKLGEITKIDPINVRNEFQAMKDLKKGCEEIMATFDTTLAEDNKMLNDGDSKLTMNVRCCVIMRRGEKEILQAYIDLVKHLEEIHDKDYNTAMKYYKRVVKGNAKEPSIEWRMERYFEEFWFPLVNGDIEKIRGLEEMNNSLGDE